MSTQRSLHRRDDGDDDREIWELNAGVKNEELNSALGKSTSILLATATAGSVASVIDILNPASPAAATGTQQPTGAAAANGLPELSFDGNDVLEVPCIAARIGSPRWALAMWVRPTGVAGLQGLLSIRDVAGTSAARMYIAINNTDLIIDGYHSAFVIRRGTFASLFAALTRVFLTVEYDGTQATDATKCIVTVNAGAPATGVFTDDTGTPGAMPSTLVQPTGTYAMGSTTNPAGSAFTGRMGPLIAIAQPSVSISGGGTWTAGERTALMNHLRPT